MQQGEVFFMKMRLFLRSRAGLTLILSLVASLMLVAANTRTSKEFCITFGTERNS
jgi:hypothetical protein